MGAAAPASVPQGSPPQVCLVVAITVELVISCKPALVGSMLGTVVLSPTLHIITSSSQELCPHITSHNITPSHQIISQAEPAAHVTLMMLGEGQPSTPQTEGVLSDDEAETGEDIEAGGWMQGM